MLRLSASVCIDAPPEQVWADLARLEAIELWSEPVLSARCAPGRDRGVGAVRVCRLRGGLLGYAQFPGGAASTDGVVITHSAFGTRGTARAPFDGGRTAVHEIGHWLNLRHIWGDDDEGCSGSDFVADTPNQAGPNLGSPSFPTATCGNAPNGDMFMNYMDYTDDAAMFMFTKGQAARMDATLDNARLTLSRQAVTV